MSCQEQCGQYLVRLFMGNLLEWRLEKRTNSLRSVEIKQVYWRLSKENGWARNCLKIHMKLLAG